MITIKSENELRRMRQAGRLVALVLAGLRERVKPGVVTASLDAWAEQTIRQHGGVPSFKGYRGYPASVCISVDAEVVHGIPSRRRLQEGQIVSLDVGVIYEGYHGDAAITVGVGEIGPLAASLLAATQDALTAGIDAAWAGRRLGDVSNAIQRVAEERGYGVVRQYVGHGIGKEMHEDPPIPNHGEPGRGPLLRPGMTLALEPMLTAGDSRTRVAEDQWTVLTVENCLAAHFEHTILVTEGEAEILTRP
ncbi:MAG: type I methionyl aminopeptidase [Anaerolineae bacterium]